MGTINFSQLTSGHRAYKSVRSVQKQTEEPDAKAQPELQRLSGFDVSANQIL